MISSTRLRNSGRNVFFRSDMTMLRISASVRPASAPVCWAKPRLRRLSVMAFAPTFEVMTTTALEIHLAPERVRELPVLHHLQQETKTSSCAFSISSKSTTAYWACAALLP